MPSFIKNLTFDCEDALRVARFWAAALVSDVDEESTSERAYVEAPGWGGPNIWFWGGRGPKSAPNRVHVDLRALTSMGEEVERLIALGATDAAGPIGRFRWCQGCRCSSRRSQRHHLTCRS
ncbi:MAG: VOC family protein [Actinomycetota bacterium]